MRDIPAALQCAIAKELMSLAFCWRIRRRDGVAIGLTTHDRTVEVDGVPFLSAPGIVPSAISLSDGIDGGSMEVSGSLSHDAIRAVDINDGRFDDAVVEFMAVDWRQPAAGAIALASGRLGDIEQSDDAFQSELKTAASQLSAVPVELCSPECRARLGDRRCRVNLLAHTRMVEIVAVIDPKTVRLAQSLPDGDFAYGRLRPVDGVLAGLDYEIIRSSGVEIELREDIANRLAPGVRVQIREGCDRRFSTCRDRFANQHNFRGEPHVPGTDSIMRYPSL